MTLITRPMLAATVTAETLDKIEWPMVGSPKIDGIRCLIHPELGPVTRSFKSVPNVHIRERLMDITNGLPFDGELIAVDESGNPLSFNATQSAVMCRGGQPLFEYRVFDYFDPPNIPFEQRLAKAWDLTRSMSYQITFVQHKTLFNRDEFLEYARECVEQGYEGTMLRRREGPYKSGRSTLKQGWLVKYKEWVDAEGTIVGFEELYHNDNPDERHDHFDLAKRSSHKANMRPAGTLGALILDTEWGELRVGSGFDMSLRQTIWERNVIKDEPTEHGERYVVRGPQPDLGRKVTFKYQPFGMQDKPRFPIFMRFREEE